MRPSQYTVNVTTLLSNNDASLTKWLGVELAMILLPIRPSDTHKIDFRIIFGGFFSSPTRAQNPPNTIRLTRNQVCAALDGQVQDALWEPYYLITQTNCTLEFHGVCQLMMLSQQCLACTWIGSTMYDGIDSRLSWQTLPTHRNTLNSLRLQTARPIHLVTPLRQ